MDDGQLIPAALPDGDERLDARVAAGRLSEQASRAIGARLADRHGAARCDDQTSFAGSTEKLSSELRMLCDRVREQAEPAPWLPATRSFLTDFLLRHAERIRARLLAGCVRAVHGHLDDTRVAVSEDGARVRIQQPFPNPLGPACADVARDLVDLHAGLEEAGLSREGELLLSSYAERALDFRFYGVFDFQSRLQALRRRVWYATVAGGSGRPALRRRCAREVERAGRQLAHAPLPRPASPLVVATGGQVGTGKSTVARGVASALAAPRLEADRMRHDLIEDPPVDPVHPTRGVDETEWERSFAPGFTDAVYAEMFRQARLVVDSGRPVVIDGCFGRRRLREAARRMADECGARFVFLECRLPRELHRRRIAQRERQRGSDPEAWALLAAEFEKQWEPATELARAEHHVVDTSEGVDRTRARVGASLRALAGPPGDGRAAPSG